MKNNLIEANEKPVYVAIWSVSLVIVLAGVMVIARVNQTLAIGVMLVAFGAWIEVRMTDALRKWQWKQYFKEMKFESGSAEDKEAA